MLPTHSPAFTGNANRVCVKGRVRKKECGGNEQRAGGWVYEWEKVTDRHPLHVHLRTCTRTHTCAHAPARTHSRTHVPAFVSGVISGSPGPPAMMVVMYRGFVYVLFAIRPAL